MAQIRLGLGQVNIVNHLIVRARKTTSPLIEAARVAFAPPHPTLRNVVLPAVGSLPDGIYYVDILESSNGVALGLKLIELVYDLKNQMILSEKIYYRAGYVNPTDPAAGSDTINDPYLDGKNITGVYREGFRPLVPPSYVYKEYDLVTGGGIQLLNGQTFGLDEVIVIEVTYAGGSGGSGTGSGVVSGLYDGVVIIDQDTTLGSIHRNKRLRCESAGSARLVITLENLATIPDGTFYHFNSATGNQYQTRILVDGSDGILLGGQALPEITIGKGEFLRLEKAGNAWEPVYYHDGITSVGQRVEAGYINIANTLAENGALYDGDDFPRIWYFAKYVLPNTHKIIDDNVINGGYTHPTDRLGQFVIHSSQKKFRMPNTQGLYIRGLKNFAAPGGDITGLNGRLNDYPGGIQGAQVGQFTQAGYVMQKAGTSNRVVVAKNLTDVTGPLPGDPSVTYNLGKVNHVDNVGEIYLRRI